MVEATEHATPCVPTRVFLNSRVLALDRFGPYALADQWVLMDLSRGGALVPRLDPPAAARRVLVRALRAATLPRKIGGRSAEAVVQDVAEVSTSERLERVRQLIVSLIYRRR